MMISRYEGVKDQELACLMVTRQRGEDFLVDTSPQVEMCVCPSVSTVSRHSPLPACTYMTATSAVICST